jgi:hypothetical protein
MTIRAFDPLQRRRLAVVAIILAVALAGCGDKDPTGIRLPPSPFLPRTSPANLLHNLQEAYEHRNLAEYESLLATEFTFVLSQRDQQRPGMPDSWNRETEIGIHRHLFDAALVQTLTLSFVLADTVWDPADSLYTAIASNVNFYIVGAMPAHPTDVKEYRVTNALEKFWFRKNGWTATGKADSIWTIVKWKDDLLWGRSAARSGVSEETSWGAVKAAYR